MALPALIIIDMQRGICEPSAGTRNNPQAEHVIAQLLQAWRQARAPLPGRRRGPQPAPFTDEPRQALDSLTRLDGIRASWVLPGRGTPWTAGVDELLGQLRAAASVQP